MRWHNRGSGLVEVLVSLLVVMVGVVAMTALHDHSLRLNQSAYLQSQATEIATDFFERLQSNRPIALTTNRYVSGSPFAALKCGAGNLPQTCVVSDCTPEQLADFDIAQWRHQLACAVPNASAEVSWRDQAGMRIYTVEILFDDTGNANQTPLENIKLQGVL